MELVEGVNPLYPRTEVEMPKFDYDMVFLHGLQVCEADNSWRDTWGQGENEGGVCCWPQRWLPVKDDHRVRVLTLEDPSSTMPKKGQMPQQLRETAITTVENPLRDLLEHGASSFFLVGHSMGGLPAKLMLADSLQSRVPPSSTPSVGDLADFINPHGIQGREKQLISKRISTSEHLAVCEEVVALQQAFSNPEIDKSIRRICDFMKKRAARLVMDTASTCEQPSVRSASTQNHLDYDVMSYAGESGEQDLTADLHTHLRKAGLEAFLDERDLTPGDDAGSMIKHVAWSTDVVVEVLSPDFFRSRWCMGELRTLSRMTRRGMRLIPDFLKVTHDECKADVIVGDSSRAPKWGWVSLWEELEARLEDVEVGGVEAGWQADAARVAGVTGVRMDQDRLLWLQRPIFLGDVERGPEQLVGYLVDYSDLCTELADRLVSRVPPSSTPSVGDLADFINPHGIQGSEKQILEKKRASADGNSDNFVIAAPVFFGMEVRGSLLPLKDDLVEQCHFDGSGHWVPNEGAQQLLDRRAMDAHLKDLFAKADHLQQTLNVLKDCQRTSLMEAAFLLVEVAVKIFLESLKEVTSSLLEVAGKILLACLNDFLKTRRGCPSPIETSHGGQCTTAHALAWSKTRPVLGFSKGTENSDQVENREESEPKVLEPNMVALALLSLYSEADCEERARLEGLIVKAVKGASRIQLPDCLHAMEGPFGEKLNWQLLADKIREKGVLPTVQSIQEDAQLQAPGEFMESVWLFAHGRHSSSGVFDSALLTRAIRAAGPLDNLHELTLIEVSLDSAGAKKIAEVLCQLPNLKVLELWMNAIGDDGACSLAKGLEQASLRHLEVLGLGDNEIGCTGAMAIAKALPALPALETVSLNVNEICDEGAVAIASALVALPKLKMLDLNDNCITQQGVAALAEAKSGRLDLQVLVEESDDGDDL